MSADRSPPESMGISTGKGGADVHIYGTVGHYSRRTRTYVAKTGANQLNTYTEPNHREKTLRSCAYTWPKVRGHGGRMMYDGEMSDGAPNARKAIERRLPKTGGK